MKLLNKSVLFLFFFLCLDVLFATGISELWIRLFIPVKNICYYHDPVLGDMFCPNQRTYGYVEKGYANIFINNSLGFHDIERSKINKKDVLRIHIYGDSMIAGAGVPIKKTIPSLLELYLNEKSPPMPVEAVNMASAEDSTGSELLTYQHIGKKFSPDVVIVYFMDDFHDNIFETHPRTRSPFFKLTPGGKLIFMPPIPVNTSSPWERFKRWSRLYRLMANKFLASKFYNTFTEKMRSFSFSQLDVPDQARKKMTPLEKRYQILREKAWPLTTALLKKFKQEVTNHGAQFILVDGVPITHTSAGGYMNSDVEEFCRENSILYIPMYKEYETFKTGRDHSRYFFEDSHPTARGNEVLTRILAEKLKPVLQWKKATPKDQ